MLSLLQKLADGWKPKVHLTKTNRYSGAVMVLEEINDEPRFKHKNEMLLASLKGLEPFIESKDGNYIRIAVKL
jgi:hypothetical protein